MWKRNTSRLLILTLTSVLFAPGCATLIQKTTQRIPVTSSPAGATVSVDGKPQGSTPLELRLARIKGGQIIRIESAGYDPVEIRERRSVSGGGMTAILGDLAGGAVVGYGAAALMALFKLLRSENGAFSKAEKALPYTIPAFALLTAVPDLFSGAIYSLKPAELTVTLTKADGPPRVDTIFISADEFKNIRWIRVHRDQGGRPTHGH